MSVQTAALPGRKERLAFGQMPVLAHLEELRGRRFKSVIATAIGAGVAWLFYNQILAVLVHPLHVLPEANQIIARGRLVFTAPAKVTTFIRTNTASVRAV